MAAVNMHKITRKRCVLLFFLNKKNLRILIVCQCAQDHNIALSRPFFKKNKMAAGNIHKAIIGRCAVLYVL